MVDEARRLQRLGWAVFPVAGKIPCTRHGVKDASTGERVAAIWWERHPGRGIALATGEPSGVWALDLDGPEAVERFVQLQEEHGRVPETVVSRTRHGYHLLFRMPEERDVRNSAGQVGEGIDVRGTGGYVVLPPSPHPDGGAYRWLRAPWGVSVKPAPGWLLDLVAPSRPDPWVRFAADAEPHDETYIKAAIEAECEELASTPEGRRNHRLNKAAFSLARFVAAGEARPEPVVRALAHAAARAGLPGREIEKTVESAFRARGAL